MIITDNFTTISPAYGRDYKTAVHAEKDFRDGKDFKMESIHHGGMYCSIRDFAPGVKVMVRYNHNKSITQVEV